MVDKVHTSNIEKYIINIHEKNIYELKEAKTALPKEFWPTYSSFSNTIGGGIILGVKEDKPVNEIVGVENPEKIIKDLWNTLSNKQKVSYNGLSDEDIVVEDINGKKVIIVSVPEAERNFKPVYLNGHYENAYIRKGDGDYKVTDPQLRAMLRNANPVYDKEYINGMSMDAFDLIAVASYKEKVSVRYPQHNYEKYTPIEFLQRLGAIKINDSGSINIGRGALLFFGKYEKIKEFFPSYFLDYINRPNPDVRWIDRVATDDLSEMEMNLYNFFNIVFEKMKAIIIDKFQLNDESVRVKSSNFEIAIREALTNCLAHADYMQAFPSIKIEASKNWFLFKNPGQMLVSIEQFVNGGDSRPRNEMVMSFFRYLGISERQGEGGPSIYKSAIESDYRLPELSTNLEQTELKLWHVDLVESHPELNEDEQKIYYYLYRKGVAVKFSEIEEATGMTEYKIRKCLNSLNEKELVLIMGTGKATRYFVTDKDRILEHMKMLLGKLQNHL